MANTAQAKKRAHQAEIHRVRNTAQRSNMRTSIKKIVKAIAAGDKAVAQQTFQETSAVIDKTAGKGLIHKNKAARLKSRLNARLRALA